MAQKIVDRECDEKIAYGVLDSACWANINTGVPTVAEEINKVLIKNGHTTFRECGKGRMAMAEEIKLRLEGYKRKDGVQIPALRFFSTCFHNLRTFPLVTHDKRQPEKIDTNGEDHCVDETGYACLSRPYKPTRSEKDGWKFKKNDYENISHGPSAWAY